MKHYMSLLSIGLGSAVLFALVCTSSAQAQTDDLIDNCEGNFEQPEEEIACLRNAIRNLLESNVGDIELVQDPSLGIENDVTKDIETVQTESAAIESAHAPLPPTGIGSEQVAARQDRQQLKSGSNRHRDDHETSQVVDFTRSANGRLILILDNGQVWAQRGGDVQNINLRDGEHTPVTIKRGAISGYRIHFVEKRRTITAERLR